MKLHKASTLKYRLSDGLTTIEVLVVIGIFSMLVVLGLFLSMDVWRGSSFRSEQDIVISLLYKARSRALSNINESDHGLYIDTVNDEYVVFEGSSYPGSGDNFPMSDEIIEFPGGNTEIVFSARTGETSGTSFEMRGQGRTLTFTINEEGGITW